MQVMLLKHYDAGAVAGGAATVLLLNTNAGLTFVFGSNVATKDLGLGLKILLKAAVVGGAAALAAVALCSL